MSGNQLTERDVWLVHDGWSAGAWCDRVGYPQFSAYAMSAGLAIAPAGQNAPAIRVFPMSQLAASEVIDRGALREFCAEALLTDGQST